MATLRRITPSTAISTPARVIRPGKNMFDVLSEGMASFHSALDPLAREQARRDGSEAGAAAAGNYTPSQTGPSVPAMPAAPVGGGSGSGVVEGGAGRDAFGGLSGGGPVSIAGALRGVDEGLVSMAQEAWGYVMPEGSSIEVTTGVSSHSPNNHAPGRAIDFRVTRPDGSIVRYDDPEALRAAQFGRALGVGGFGAGDTYMGGTHFHWDINSPRTWSDDDRNADDRDPTGAAGWGPALAEAERLGVQGLLAAAGVTEEPVDTLAPPADAVLSGGAGQGQIDGGGINDTLAGAPPPVVVPEPSSSSQTPQAAAPAVTTIRTETGRLETRPLSIFTSPYEMIRQNAALGAYSAGVSSNASLAMADMRRQFRGDPEGFQRAAGEYVRHMGSMVPGVIREQMTSELQTEAARAYSGMLDQQLTQTLTRARQEVSARASMQADEYAQLLAAGDTVGAETALQGLRSTLDYRSQIPGSTWGPEQTEMVISGAQASAAAMRERASENSQREIGGMLSDIRRDRLDGRVSAFEHILDSDEAQAHPEFAPTMATVEFTNFMGQSFPNMPAAAREEMIEAERGTAVDDYDRHFLGAMEQRHEQISVREREDPIVAAEARGVDIGALDMDNPESVVSFLRNRRAISRETVAQGFIPGGQARFFTNDEREAFAPMISADAEPAQRVALAQMLLTGLEGDAGRGAVELGMSEAEADAIRMAHVTGSTESLRQELTGHAMMRAGQARTIPADVRMSPEALTVLEALPPIPSVRERMIQRASAMVAFSEGMAEPTAQDFAEALQTVAGGRAGSGGVQQVFGYPTILPPNTTGGQMETALRNALSRGDEGLRGDRATQRAGGDIDRAPLTDEELHERWGPRGAPMMDQEIMPFSVLSQMELRPAMLNGEIAHGFYTAHADGFDAVDQNGDTYVFNMRRLLRGLD